MKILTANQQYIVKQRGGYRAFINHEMKNRWNIAPVWKIDRKAPPIFAWVNRSSWAGNCECGGSLVVEPDEPYICPDCGNAMYGGKARKVIFPKNRAEIERLLLNRPYPNNRNWLPTETLADLRRQNREQGDKT